MSEEEAREAMMNELQEIAQKAIQERLDNQDYKSDKVEKWSLEIMTGILSKLRETRTPQYKFITSCMILSMQSRLVNETQMALWDPSKDIKITTKWANETMQCIVSVWAFRTKFCC